MKQKISIGVTLLLVVGGIYGFIAYQKEKDYKPLFTHLASEDAGLLAARLKEKNVEYKIAEDGTTVLVRSARVNELRLELAAQGLPRTGRIGFEIFDKTNFALTEFAEQVNYQRALEGELERTVGSIKEVDHARVHLTMGKQSIFEDKRQPAKASIVLQLKSGNQLPPNAVQAMIYMFSSAVEGLSPEHIAIIDQNGRLLNRPRKTLGPDEELPEVLLEYRQKIEKDLLAKLNSTLTPLLGEDKYRAGITVDCDMTTAEASEETYDPEKAVVLSEQKTEDVSGIQLASGVPGTPSNLPRPASRPASSGSGTQRKTENTSYQASRFVRRTRTPQGAIKRISLSVLLDQDVRWEGVGAKAKRVVEVPTPEKIKAIKDVVSASVGLVPDRGDVVLVETLPFEATLKIPAPQAPVPPAPPKPVIEIPPALINILPPPLRDPNVLLAVLIASGLLVLILGLAVFFFLRKRAKKKAAAELAKKIAAEEQGQLEGDTRSFEERLAEQQEMHRKKEQEELERLKMPNVETQKGKILAQHVIDEAKKDPMVIAQILRSWLHER